MLLIYRENPVFCAVGKDLEESIISWPIAESRGRWPMARLRHMTTGRGPARRRRPEVRLLSLACDKTWARIAAAVVHDRLPTRME